MEMNKLLDDRNNLVSDIARLTIDKREIEGAITERLIEDKNFDCFTVNFRRVHQCYGGRQQR